MKEIVFGPALVRARVSVTSATVRLRGTLPGICGFAARTACPRCKPISQPFAKLALRSDVGARASADTAVAPTKDETRGSRRGRQVGGTDVSTTEDRVKARALRRDPRAALHVSGPHFWSYAVAECDAELSEVAATPGDAVCLELLAMRSDVHGDEEKEAFFGQMIDARRLVVRLRVRRLYGLVLPHPPGG